MTLKANQAFSLQVFNYANKPDWLTAECNVMVVAEDQNRLRRYLAVLTRMGLGRTVFDGIFVVWHPADKSFKVWVRRGSWEGRSSYYAGMIHAYNRLRPMKRKRKRVYAGHYNSCPGDIAANY